jgi:hypothetical protein
VLGSTNAVNVQPPFQNGWMNATFPTNIGGASPNVHRLINSAATTISGGSRAMTTVGNTVTYTGLPVIGFSVTSFANGTVVVGGQNVLSNYGGGFVHKTNTINSVSLPDALLGGGLLRRAVRWGEGSRAINCLIPSPALS